MKSAAKGADMNEAKGADVNEAKGADVNEVIVVIEEVADSEVLAFLRYLDAGVTR